MRKFIILLIAVILSSGSMAQRSEIGFMMGTSFYQGELNNNNFFVAPMAAGGLLFRYAINPLYAVKISAYYGEVMGDDQFTGGIDERNLSFQSSILDISPQIELNLMKYATGSRYSFTPYVFFGVSLFFFNPKADFNGEVYELQSLGTEGQGTTGYPDRTPYSLSQIAIPFGVGFKFSIGKNTSLGLEYGVRKTFTDYLDDVSTTYADSATLSAENTVIAALLADRSIFGMTEGTARGNEDDKDWYTFVGLTLTFKIRSGSGSCPAYESGKTFRDYIRLQ